MEDESGTQGMKNQPREQDLESDPGKSNEEIEQGRVIGQDEPERREVEDETGTSDVEDVLGKTMEEESGKRDVEDVLEKTIEEESGKRDVEDVLEKTVEDVLEKTVEDVLEKTVEDVLEKTVEEDSAKQEDEPEQEVGPGILKDERKPPGKKKRVSIADFFTGKSSEDDEKSDEPSGKVSRRPTFLRNKLIALEKELTFDNIHEKVTSVFQYDRSKKRESKEVDETGAKPKRIYLSSTMAAMFLVSATTGSAIMCLPYYLKESSWFGLFLELLLGLNAMYAGLCIGWCWSIMEEKWPEYLDYTRVPYQDIAYRAVGTWMKYIVAICIDISLLGSCAVYIIHIAESVENLVFRYLKMCPSLIIIAAILMCFIMFGSYRNIKFIAILDVSCSILFTFFTVVSLFFDQPLHEGSTYSDPSFYSVVTAFAGFSYAYGSGSILPSIMVDMADRSMFTHTFVTSYMVVIVIYVLLPILGYAAYGDETPKYILQNILLNKNLNIFGNVTAVVYVLQLGTTFIVALLPSLHAFEERFNCPDEFCCFRLLIRLSILVLLVLLILGVPYLPKFMDLVGATTMNLLTFIFPPIFYVCLVYQKKSQYSKGRVGKKEWILLIEMMLLGIIVGVISTYVSVINYIKSLPNRESCFFNMTAAPHNKPWLLALPT